LPVRGMPLSGFEVRPTGPRSGPFLGRPKIALGGAVSASMAPRMSEEVSRAPAYVCLFFAVLVGCAGEAPEAETKWAVEREKQNGPVTALIRVSDEELTIADRLRVEIEVRAAPEWQIELPTLGDELEALSVSDYGSYGPEAVGEDNMRQGKWYVLEPFLSGEYEIPGLEVAFFKVGEEKEHSVTTDPVKVKVKSLMGEEREKLRDIHPVKDVVSLPPPGRVWIAVVAAVVLAVGAAFVVGVRMLRGREGSTAAPPPLPPAHVVAYRRLQELVDRDLVGQGLTGEFYVGLSDVIRRYIEDRFGLHAPERTTEEFLAEVSSGKTLSKRDTALLDEFLVHCDLVKFARHEPTSGEIQRSFDSAKAFIEGTKVS
jgi:hypothetical protein